MNLEPTALSLPASSTETAELPVGARPAKILIADDDPIILTLVEATLSGLKPAPDLVTVTNGNQAIRSIEREPPDLVITDIRMPGADGLQLLAHVVNERLTTPVITMTGYATAQLRADIMDKGAYLLLEKPLDPDELLQAAKDGLRRDDERKPAAFSLTNILQLIEMESKSCEVSVANDEHGGGFLVFSGGRLVHARTHETSGDQAALDILSLPAPYIDVREAMESHPATVTRDLERLLLEISRGNPETTDPRVFETVQLPTARMAAQKDPEGLQRYRELLTLVQGLRGFCAVSLVDMSRCSNLLSETAESFEQHKNLVPAPVCHLIQAEKALIEGNLEAPASILIRQREYWHLIRELKNMLALHIVFDADANIALAQYRLSRWLQSSDLAEEIPGESGTRAAAVP